MIDSTEKRAKGVSGVHRRFFRVRLVQCFNHRWPFGRCKSSLARWASRLLPSADGAVVCHGVQGNLRMRLDLAVEYQRRMYLNYYEDTLVRVLRKLLRAGDVFVDGGANVGYLTLMASECVGQTGKVHAFEPHPANLALLRENVQLNGVDNVIAWAKGCWCEQGTAEIYAFHGASPGTFSMGRRPDMAVAEKVTIETTRIDDVVEPVVKVLKLDIEGAELPAAKGAEQIITAKDPPHLIVELNPVTTEAFGYHPMELVDWIEQRYPLRKLHLLGRKRSKALTRAQLAKILDDKPHKYRNVWFEPES